MSSLFLLPKGVVGCRIARFRINEVKINAKNPFRQLRCRNSRVSINGGRINEGRLYNEAYCLRLVVCAAAVLCPTPTTYDVVCTVLLNFSLSLSLILSLYAQLLSFFFCLRKLHVNCSDVVSAL